jgi:phosphoglycerate dehydrogenase-like enzyme
LKRAVLCCSKRMTEFVYAMGRREHLTSLVDLDPTLIDESNFDQHIERVARADVIFSTWGMPKLTPKRLEAIPDLKAIFYAAGTVKGFAPLALQRGIVVVSAWRMNAIPVAEFTLAQILLSTKRYFANSDACTDPVSRAKAPTGRGNFGQTVALLGAGAIGRHVILLLKPFALDVIVFDPYLSDDDARALGVRKVTLEEAFIQGNVVSNHIANIPATVGMLRGEHFRSMQPGATFINTGRGAQVKEAEMIDALKARPDLYALLDVTDPEPPVPSSPLWAMPNVKLSSHIAGSIGNEVVRMADLVIEEFKRFETGEPLQHQVTLDMLDRMA